jgi:PAS domain S-box-containing protein
VRDSPSPSFLSAARQRWRLETRFQELKRYVAFTEGDALLLAALEPHAAPHFARIAQEFYDKIREHEDAHAVFKDEAQIARLQSSLQRWMGRILSGIYDEAYFAESQKIGRVHVRVGLPQRYMLTAMALIRVQLTRIAERALGTSAAPTAEALTRLLDLELAIMLETYGEDTIARAQRLERLEKQELSRALLRTEHRYVNAVELARLLIVGLDAHGDVRLFNREAERVSGFARDEVLQRPFTLLLQEDLVETIGGEILGAAAGAATARDVVECAIRTKSGKYRDVRWQLAYARLPSSHASGGVLGPDEDDVVLFAIGQDLTEELALKEKTVQHEKLAAVGTLAAGLAHEIRNPLNGALLHVSFLERAIKKRGGDPAMLDAVKVVGDEIKRLAALVTEFLDFARPRPPLLAPVQAFPLCERVIHLVSPQADEAHVKLALDLPTRDPVLLVDAAKIEQVLLNLVANAIEALEPTGGGLVTLRLRRQPRSVFFEVEDTGPGLVAPDAPIFDPFFSTKPNGTGLGLAISHRIASDHGADLAVDSKPGRTVFRLTLPLEQE